MAQFITGISKVRVMRREVNPSTGKEVIRVAKTGIVVQQGTSFARVYDAQPVQDGGDPSQVNAEKFPFSSLNCWLEPMGELKYALKIAPELAQ